jgi:cystathionine beta-lyase/cystathionine gamma-synthase
MSLDPSTIVAHDEGFPAGAVVPPIFQTSLFTFGSYQELEDAMAGTAPRPIYSRGDNPTVRAFEAKMAALEGAEAARAFASGMAAISAAVLSNLRAGERMVCVRHCYPDAFRLFTTVLPRFEIRVDFVDGQDAPAVERALPGAKVLYLESPTSVVFETQDLPRLAAMARTHGALTIADNSWASPIFHQPLAHGVDLVVHSASKYLGGHSDVVAGVICGRRELIERIDAGVFPLLGGKLAPFEGWLLVRGLRTLPLRMRRHQESALEIARRLAAHPRIKRVNLPCSASPGPAWRRWRGRPGCSASSSKVRGRRSGVFAMPLPC